MKVSHFRSDKVFSCLLTVGFVLICGGFTWSDAAAIEREDWVPPEQLEPLWITIPAEIQHLISEDAIARVAIRLSETGVVTDWIPLQLPHYKLWSAIGKSTKYMEFSPALVNGIPMPVDMAIEIPVGEVKYYGVLSLTLSTYLESRVASISPDLHQLLLVPASELDHPLKVLSRGEITIPVDDDGNPLKGEVMVEFYVDIEGKVRMTDSDESLHPIVRNAAHLTVEQFSFNKPTCKGNPAVTKARIMIRY